MPDAVAQQPSTLVAIGDRSPLGRAIVNSALPRFEVEALLLPTDAMYERFRIPEQGSRASLAVRRAKTRLRQIVRRRRPEPLQAEELAQRLSWQEVEQTWQAGQFDLFLSGGFPAIFPDAVLARGVKAVNVHTSLLPQLKGRHPHYWAVAGGL